MYDLIFDVGRGEWTLMESEAGKPARISKTSNHDLVVEWFNANVQAMEDMKSEEAGGESRVITD